MITINVLPEEFRIRQKTRTRIPISQAVVFIGLALFVMTFIFYIDFLVVAGKLKRLEGKWKGIQPEYLLLTQLQGEVEGKLKQEKDFMTAFVTADRSLARILTWGSEFLPPGVWLTELKMEREGEGGHFFLKGLAVPAPKQTSIEQIEAYLHHLKEMMPDTNLSLTTTRLQMEGIELTQFISHFDWGRVTKK